MLSRYLSDVSILKIPKGNTVWLKHYHDKTSPHLQWFIKATELSLDIFDKKTAKVLLEIAAKKLEKNCCKDFEVPLHLKTELNELHVDEKSTSPHCSV